MIGKMLVTKEVTIGFCKRYNFETNSGDVISLIKGKLLLYT
jgi:hypothetical protein